MLVLAPVADLHAVRIAAMPAEEPRSARFRVRVDRREVPVLIARVPPGDPTRKAKLAEDGGRTPGLYDEAAFASWDMDRPVRVTVTAAEPIREFRILPTSAKLTAKAEGRTITFAMATPRPITVEVNGDVSRSLHLFANPFERDVPKPGDPGVMFFGPGIHEVDHLPLKAGSTVYVADGAIVRCRVGAKEEGWSNGNGERGYPPAFEFLGDGITLRGRGVIDGALLPVHARNLVSVVGRNAKVEGVILRDPPVWAMPVRRTDGATIRNVKILGYRANSDGIDLCNSRDALVEDCFLRTFDDLVVIKSDKDQGPVRGIRVRRCTLWNELAHALSLGAELREPVSDVVFEDCDVIRDRGREWTLRVFQSDAATIRNVRFERIRIEETPRLASLWIGKTVWGRDEARGRIENVAFRDVDVASGAARIELTGHDAEHGVRDVAFDRVRLSGRPLVPGDLTANPFVAGVRITP